MSLALKKRSNDPKALSVIRDAVLCKAFGCTPSQLRMERSDELQLYALVYAKLAESNPGFLLL